METSNCTIHDQLSVGTIDEVGGKASSLLYLENNGFNVPEFFPLTFEDINNPVQLKGKIEEFLSRNPEISTCAVRSSALHEDGQSASFAGKYSTKLSVPAALDPIVSAIDAVKNEAESQSEAIRQYSNTLNVVSDERLGIVVQRMVEFPEFAGVVFSRGTENPHYMEVSYHNGLGEDLVSGKVNGKQMKVIRGVDAPEDIGQEAAFLPELIRVVNNIEDTFGYPVDVEFAYKNNELYILQARPIKGMSDVLVESSDGEEILIQVLATYDQLRTVLDNNFLGSMIDINPQELLGKYPLPLSFSMFSAMFPAKVIPEARAALGYACSKDNCLHLLSGRAFIDFKTAASNFRPEGISEEDYEKIYDYYLAEIRHNPSKQNKVEFKLFFCLDDEETRSKLMEIFDQDEQKVCEILNCFGRTETRIDDRAEELMGGLSGDIEKYLALIEVEKEKIGRLLKQEGAKAVELKAVLEEILGNIQRYGTFLFTQVARMDFFYNRKLAELLESNNLVDYTDVLLSGNKSIYMEFVAGLLELGEADGEADKARKSVSLEDRFGHMRQSQFDLHEPNFNEQKMFEKAIPDVESLKSKLDDNTAKNKAYVLTMQELESFMSTDSFAVLRELVEKTRFCDEARERVKFVFMKEYDLLRPLLLYIQELFGLDNFDEIFYLTFEDIIFFLSADFVPKDVVKERIVQNKVREKVFRQMEMPDVIMHDYDVLAVQNRANESVFISSLPEVNGEVLYVPKASKLTDFDVLRDKILLLEDSDQGSSHLFNFGIKGVITKVGSAHSHMAVLLREYGLPAVLAVGEEMFRKLKNVGRVSINCREKSIQIE